MLLLLRKEDLSMAMLKKLWGLTPVKLLVIFSLLLINPIILMMGLTAWATWTVIDYVKGPKKEDVGTEPPFDPYQN